MQQFAFITYLLLSLNGGLSSHDINVQRQSRTSATADIVSVLTIACLLDAPPELLFPLTLEDELLLSATSG